MADERDPNNPIDAMMPPVDNPEYHRKLAEHKSKLRGNAEAAILSDPTHAAISDRLTSVRQDSPQAAAPQPLPPTDVPPLAPPAYPEERTGLTVDPTVGQVKHTPVESRLPEGAVSPAAPVAAPVAPAEPPAPKGNVTPILSKLREDFGIDSISMEDIEVNGHKFTMRVLNTGAVTQALRFADTLSMPGSDRENAINLQIALTSFAIVSIDGEPVYKVFDVPVPDVHMVMVEGVSRPQFSPTDPPSEIRILGATQLMDFLSGQASSSLLSELWAQYGAKVDPKGTLEQLMGSIEEPESTDIPLP